MSDPPDGEARGAEMRTQRQDGPADRPGAAAISPAGSPSAPTAPALTRQEAAARRKRQQRLKKLEQRQEKLERRLLRRHNTPPGQRIFEIPKRVHPVSLFIRMGSLASEQDVIPLEYYDLQSSESGSEEMGYSDVTPHPEVDITKRLIHLDERERRRPSPAIMEEAEKEGETATAGERSVPLFSGRRSGGSKRPNSIQLPLQSAMKKPDSRGAANRRPRSLRFLDPKDQKLYDAVSHSDFLKHLPEAGPSNDIGESLAKLRLLGAGGGPSGMLVTSADEESTASTQGRKPFALPLTRSLSPAPRSDAGCHADEEATDRSVVDWGPAAEEISPSLRTSSKSMPPTFSREITSGESSDISGYEADLEERYVRRRGSQHAK